MPEKSGGVQAGPTQLYNSILITLMQGYLFINLLFCVCLVWSMAAPQVEPLLVSLGVNILAIVFEVVFLCVHWPPAFTSHHLFSAVMAVTNLVARIVSSLVILLDVKKFMEADPKYKVETPEKEKDVSIGD